MASSSVVNRPTDKTGPKIYQKLRLPECGYSTSIRSTPHLEPDWHERKPKALSIGQGLTLTISMLALTSVKTTRR